MSGDAVVTSIIGKISYLAQHTLNIIFLNASMSLLSAIYKIINSSHQKLEDIRKNSKHELQQNLKIFSKIHMKICEICQNFCEYFVLIHLYLLFSAFSSLTIQNYTIFAFFKEPNLENFLIIPFGFLWVVMMTNYMAAFVTISCFIHWRACIIQNVLSEICNLKLTRNEYKRIFILQQQISHQNILVTCGVFKIDMHFLFDFSAYLFSISIMLFQLYGFNKRN